MGRKHGLKCLKCGRTFKLDELNVMAILSQKANCPACRTPIRVQGDPVAALVARSVSTQEITTRAGSMLKIIKLDGVAIAGFTVTSITDTSYVQQLSQELVEMVDRHGLRRIVLDFGGLKVMSSSVITALLGLERKVKETGGAVRLCDVSPDIFEIFQLTRAEKLFAVDDTLTESVQQLHSET